MTQKNEKGFTLVELIVTVVLLTLLVGAGYAFFFVFTKEKTETAAYMKEQMQAEAFIDALGRYTRSANYLSPAFEPKDSVYHGVLQRYQGASIKELSHDSVYFNRFGVGSSKKPVRFAGFRLKDTTIGGVRYRYLQELDSAGTYDKTAPVWKNFVAGVGGVLLFSSVSASSTDSVEMPKRYGKAFYMPSGKLLSTLETNNLVLRTITGAKDTFDLKLERGMFRCRR
jgi:prepilin-type N-terminal cleavage/methylation domain-containing protein